MSRGSLLHIFFCYVEDFCFYSHVSIQHSIIHHLHMILSGFFMFFFLWNPLDREEHIAFFLDMFNHFPLMSKGERVRI